MLIKPLLTLGIVAPALFLGTVSATDHTESAEAVTVPGITSSIVATESTDGMSCQFAIRAKNNMSFDVWVDLYNSTMSDGGFGLWGGHSKLEIQPHRLGPGKSMDRRYTASGRCSKERNWQFYVHIGRTDGKKIYEYVNKRTKGDGDRTINLGNSSTWGL